MNKYNEREIFIKFLCTHKKLGSFKKNILRRSIDILNAYLSYFDYCETNYIAPQDYIVYAFGWGKTNEGFAYWHSMDYQWRGYYNEQINKNKYDNKK